MASAHPQYGGKIFFWFLMILLFLGESKILIDKSVRAVRRAKTAIGVASCRANPSANGLWWLVRSAVAQVSSPSLFPDVPLFIQ